MTLVMIDSIDVSELKHALNNMHVDALAGYTSGRWPTWQAVEALAAEVGVKALSIAISSANNAECLDIESGDATNSEAPAWYRRQRSIGVARPCLYTSAGNVAALVQQMSANGIRRAAYRIWSAHYAGYAHICGPHPSCGFPQAEGTQWTDGALGRNLDQSLLDDTFFGIPPKPKPKPAPQPLALGDDEMPLLVNGKNAVTPLVVPAGAKNLLFVADEGQQQLPAAKLRVGASSPWAVQEVDVSWVKSPVQVKLPASAARVTITRLDEGTVNVAYLFA